MKKKTKDKLDTEIDNYIDRTINILSGNAGLAFVAGEIKASSSMGISYDKPSPDSLVYAKAYRQLLVDEGATIINGEKVYWMADREKELRQKVYDAIEQGFKEGRKTYGSGSIADDIAEILGMEHWKAQRISRTEVKRIMNAGTIQRYERNKVKYVQVLDNEGENSCEECAKINGQKWDIEYAASHELEHPNCFIDYQVPIFTSNGWIPIGKIRVGDLVLTHKGRFRKVTELIQTPKQIPEVITIEIGNSNTNNKKITVTKDHPILTSGGWKYAKDLTEFDCIKVLAKKCQCGELIPYWRNVCDFSCNGKHIMVKLRDDPIWMDKSRTAQKKKMQEIYSSAENRKKQTESARLSCMELLKNNAHPFQKLETHIKSNRALARNKYRTYLEKKIAWLLDEMKIPYTTQPIIYRKEIINGRPRYYKPDFLLNEHNIIIECDGSYWHDKENPYEIERQRYLESLGYLVIRFTEEDIRNNLEVCQNALTRVLMNHNKEFEFLEMKIKSLGSWIPKKQKTLYNFSVVEDESYIANGIIVHNCVRSFIPIFEEELPEGFVPDNLIEEEMAKRDAINPEFTKQLLQSKFSNIYQLKGTEQLIAYEDKDKAMALSSYKSHWHRPINSYLRDGENGIYEYLKSMGYRVDAGGKEEYMVDQYVKESERWANLIRDIMKSSGVPKDTTSLRGISSRLALEILSSGEYNEKGFGSWSTDGLIALEFPLRVEDASPANNYTKYLLKTVLPKGLAAADGVYSEREIITIDGIKYRVIRSNEYSLEGYINSAISETPRSKYDKDYYYNTLKARGYKHIMEIEVEMIGVAG